MKETHRKENFEAGTDIEMPNPS